MQKSIIKRAFLAYGYPDVRLIEAKKGYRNTSHFAKNLDELMFNLIVYKDEVGITSRIERIHDVSYHLAQNNLPVRAPLSTRILTLRSSGSTRYAALYNYLHGETIAWEGYTKHHIKLVGMGLAHIHAALQDTQYASDFPHVHDELLAIIDTMVLYFGNEGVSLAMRHKLHTSIKPNVLLNLKKIIKMCSKLPNKQPLHMDFVRGNILFCENDSHSHELSISSYSISGILDLEKTAVGHPIFDIARTLAFLIVDSKYKSEEKVRKYFLRSGYVKRGERKLPNIHYEGNDVLESLITLFLLYDYYKFMKHNPYESLEYNEHYIRTKNALQQKGVLV